MFVTGPEPDCIAAIVVNKHLPPLPNKQRLADIKWRANGKEERGCMSNAFKMSKVNLSTAR